MTPPQRDFVIWYKGGAGGFFVGWLLNIALDPSVLNVGLSVFPTVLEKNSQDWKYFEKTPPNVGVLCNMFFPEPEHNYSPLTTEQLFTNLLLKLQTQGQNVNDLLPIRTKFFLINYVLESAGATVEKRNNINYSYVAEKYPLTDFKFVTDVIFDHKKNIFLITPEEYTRLACLHKKSRYLSLNVEEVLTSSMGLQTFKLESIWKNYWQSEIEKLLGRQLTTDQYTACNTFIERYMQVMPKQLLEFCYAN